MGESFLGNQLDQLMNTAKWNRKMLNAYWYSLLLYAGTTSLNIAWIVINQLDVLDLRRSILENLLGGTALIAGLLLFVGMFARRGHSYADYVIISAGTLSSLIIIYLNSDIRHIHSIILLPMLLSMFYFQTRKLLFACIINTTGLVMLVWFAERVYKGIWFPNIIPMIAISIAGCLILRGVMTRGEEIHRSLKVTIAAQQNLLAQTDQMTALAYTDSLTGLSNHQAFHHDMDMLLHHAISTNIRIHLVIIDIDNFKRINDTYGHSSGDAVLIRCAELIQRFMTDDAFSARYGGEEFTVVYRGMQTEEVVRHVNKLREAFATLVHLELDRETATASFGISEWTWGQAKEDLFKHADEALYVAKKTGKNKVCVYEEKEI
jgi:diguanylate cyclase (GGDEF)-like protein